jgi:hypothetical protein
MKIDEFSIGLRFFMGEREWLCTDVGTRVVVAIKTDLAEAPDWLNGPPYALLEIVLDEDDLPVCSIVDNRSKRR